MDENLSPGIRDLLTLHLVPGLGPRLTKALLDKFGEPAKVLTARPEDLAEVPHIGEKLAGQLHAAMRRLDVDAEIELMAQHETGVRIYGTDAYPARLAEIPDPPGLLYVRGDILPEDGKAVALVGSRHCSPYGRRVTERLATGLVRAGYTVISGLARGIDGVAHRAALEAGGRTLAVLAGGLSRIYPPEHDDLARQVARSGALLSESGMRMEPMAGMFPARNRIISGLSQAVVIVEAAEKSGALITATHAAQQGRPVMAVPGPVDSLASGGTHALIRKGAILIRGVEDILEELEGVGGPVAEIVVAPPALEGDSLRIWETLAEGSRSLDELVQNLEIPVAKLSGILMILELKKIVRRLPGNRYERG